MMTMMSVDSGPPASKKAKKTVAARPTLQLTTDTNGNTIYFSS